MRLPLPLAAAARWRVRSALQLRRAAPRGRAANLRDAVPAVRLLEQMYADNQRRYENRMAPPAGRGAGAAGPRGRLHHADERSRRHGGGRRPPSSDSAPAIPPLSLHAGVVTNMRGRRPGARLFRGARGAGPQRRQRAARAADLSRAVRDPRRARPGAGPGAPRRVRRALSGEVLMRRPSCPGRVLTAGMAPGGARAADPARLPEAVRGLRPGGAGSIRTTSGATTGRCLRAACARPAQRLSGPAA